MKTFYLFCLLALFGTSHAQDYGLQVSYIKPSGDFGFVFKPTVGYELMLRSGDIDDRVKFGATIGYYNLTPRHDTLFNSGIQNGLYIPSYDIWYSYYVIPVALTFEFKILDRAFSPIIGLDGYINFATYDLASHGMKDLHARESAISMGILPRIGVSWEIAEIIQLQASLGRSLFVDMESFKPSNIWKIQFGVVYYYGY